MLIKNDSVTFEYINIYSLIDKNIGIPIFQRFYSWKEKQVNELLEDLNRAIYDTDRQLYLLDFIWYEENGKMMIADGQQRLVSLNLFMKAINDYIDNKNLNISKMCLFNISYDNESNNKSYKYTFEECIKNPFRKVYFKFYEFIDNNKNNLINYITILQNRIYIYAKKTENADDAFSIFTEINTGGKPLTKDEVIKTTFEQYSKTYNVDIKELGFKNIKKTITGYYKYITESNNDNFDTIAIITFLKDHVVKTKELFEAFVNYAKIVKKTEGYSISYIIQYINRNQLFDILNVLAIKGIDVRTKTEYRDNVLLPLCLLSIIMTMKKSNPGGIIRSLYTKVIDAIKEGSQAIEICEKIIEFVNENTEICKISFDEFKDSLGKKELNYKIKEALLIMDIVRRCTSSDIIVESINLEHIYPQKPAPEWAIHNWPTDSEEKSKLINNIGNFILLNESVNKKIKNKYISDKIVEYNRIIPRDVTLNSGINVVDFQRFENLKSRYILERQNKIAEYIYSNFNLGNILIVKI